MSEMAIDYQRRPITADEYERMAELGIIGPEERVELIEGEIILMPPMGEAHVSSLLRLTELFVQRLSGRAMIMPQGPVRVSSISEPQPDFAVLYRRDDYYRHGKPDQSNVYALVECAETSLRYDRGTKLRVYAKAGVREYWIVNLVAHCLEIHREPHDLGYAVREVRGAGESMAFSEFPQISFTVDELLGPAG
ncbi:MAG: Uma2 family endonuclease [Candidatus Eremiobacteraeota bacterium]|nr:Uma2 family endonuclease [Candidatus Eremiobacteraeota bacterium]